MTATAAAAQIERRPNPASQAAPTRQVGNAAAGAGICITGQKLAGIVREAKLSGLPPQDRAEIRQHRAVEAPITAVAIEATPLTFNNPGIPTPAAAAGITPNPKINTFGIIAFFHPPLARLAREASNEEKLFKMQGAAV